GLHKQTGIGGRIEGIARDIGSQRAEPKRKPGALEAGMAGNEDPALVPERAIYVHRDQNAAAAGSGCERLDGVTGQRAICSRQKDAALPSGNCSISAILITLSLAISRTRVQPSDRAIGSAPTSRAEAVLSIRP